MQLIYSYGFIKVHILKPVVGSLLPVAGYYYLCGPNIY